MARRVYEDEFKIGAVELAAKLGAKSAAEELGVPFSTLCSWIRSHKYDSFGIEDEYAEAVDFDADDEAETEVFEADDEAENFSCVEDDVDEEADDEAEDFSSGEDDEAEVCAAEEETPEAEFEADCGEDASTVPSSEDIYDEMCLSGDVRNYYFVDYENVNHFGLEGFGHLSEGDCLRIYYSDRSQTVPFTFIRELERTAARVEITKVLLQIKNGADCQILLDILRASRELRGTNFFIISKDADFDKPIADFKSQGIKIKKIRTIAENFGAARKAGEKTAAAPVSRDEQIESIFVNKLNKAPFNKHRDKILSLIKSSTDKQTLNTALTKLLPGDKIKIIYEEYKPLLGSLSPQPKASAVSPDLPNDIKSLYKQHFSSGIFKEKEAEILKILTDSKTKTQMNMALCKIIPAKEVSRIFKELKPLLKNIPGE